MEREKRENWNINRERNLGNWWKIKEKQKEKKGRERKRRHWSKERNKREKERKGKHRRKERIGREKETNGNNSWENSRAGSSWKEHILHVKKVETRKLGKMSSRNRRGSLHILIGCQICLTSKQNVEAAPSLPGRWLKLQRSWKSLRKNCRRAIQISGRHSLLYFFHTWPKLNHLLAIPLWSTKITTPKSHYTLYIYSHFTVIYDHVYLLQSKPSIPIGSCAKNEQARFASYSLKGSLNGNQLIHVRKYN